MLGVDHTSPWPSPQGLSAGVELGGVSVYLAEIAPPGRRGLYCSWQSASQQLAVVFTALIGIALTHFIVPNETDAWGWRVPFVIGCAIIPLILWLRRSLEETPVFTKMARHPQGSAEVLRIIGENLQVVLIGMLIVAFSTACFYLITAYTPTYGRQALNLAAIDTFIVTLCVGVSNFVWLLVGGALSDRVGRRPLLCHFEDAVGVTTRNMSLSPSGSMTAALNVSRLALYSAHI